MKRCVLNPPSGKCVNRQGAKSAKEESGKSGDDPRKIETLGDHLCSEQNIDVPLEKGSENLLVGAALTGAGAAHAEVLEIGPGGSLKVSGNPSIGGSCRK